MPARGINQAPSNFSLRGKSYQQGILLLLNNVISENWKLNDSVVDSLKEEIENLDSDYQKKIKKTSAFKEWKRHLNTLLKEYNEILLRHTTLTSTFRHLLIAERCAVWLAGREAIKTEVEVSQLEVTQEEKPYTDSKILLQEYAEIDKDNHEVPLWFQYLPAWQQRFIKTNKEDLANKSIPSSLRCVPGLANVSQHTFSINDEKSADYFRSAITVPVDFELLAHAGKQQDVETLRKRELARNEEFRLTCLNLVSQIRLSLDQQLEKESAANPREAVILSQSILSPGWVATFKSWLRSDPSDNDTKICAMKEQAVAVLQQALGNPNALVDSTINDLFFTKEERERSSSLCYKDLLKKWDINFEDGVFNYKEGKFNRITLLSTNHPYNILRRFGTYSAQTKQNDYNTALLFGAVARYLADHRKQPLAVIDENDVNKSLNALIEIFNRCQENKSVSKKDRKELMNQLKVFFSDSDYKEEDPKIVKLLDSVQALVTVPPGQGVFQRDGRHRQCMVSCAEANIISCLEGTFWIACKSGKDRTGVASAAIDSAAMFYKRYDRQPRWDDTKAERKYYVGSFETLLKSGHHQEYASNNAPGARGLVAPYIICPSDVKLDAKSVKSWDQFARLNKPKLSNQAGTLSRLKRVWHKLLGFLKQDKAEQQEQAVDLYGLSQGLANAKKTLTARGLVFHIEAQEKKLAHANSQEIEKYKAHLVSMREKLKEQINNNENENEKNKRLLMLSAPGRRCHEIFDSKDKEALVGARNRANTALALENQSLAQFSGSETHQSISLSEQKTVLLAANITDRRENIVTLRISKENGQDSFNIDSVNNKTSSNPVGFFTCFKKDPIKASVRNPAVRNFVVQTLLENAQSQQRAVLTLNPNKPGCREVSIALEVQKRLYPEQSFPLIQYENSGFFRTKKARKAFDDEVEKQVAERKRDLGMATFSRGL